MLKVLVRVTIGIGEVIHNSNADAREVSFGSISFISFCVFAKIIKVNGQQTADNVFFELKDEN